MIDATEQITADPDLLRLDRLEPTGAVIIAAPRKIWDGSGSPLRVLAVIRD